MPWLENLHFITGVPTLIKTDPHSKVPESPMDGTEYAALPRTFSTLRHRTMLPGNTPFRNKGIRLISDICILWGFVSSKDPNNLHGIMTQISIVFPFSGPPVLTSRKTGHQHQNQYLLPNRHHHIWVVM